MGAPEIVRAGVNIGEIEVTVHVSLYRSLGDSLDDSTQTSYVPVEISAGYSSLVLSDRVANAAIRALEGCLRDIAGDKGDAAE